MHPCGQEPCPGAWRPLGARFRPLARNVLPRVEKDVTAAIADGRDEDARAGWTAIIGDQLHVEAEYRAASWCALDRWIPLTERNTHGLDPLPRP